MNDFKWRHLQGEVILWAVCWYCRYGVSYRGLEQDDGQRGVAVDHSTIYGWVQKYAPEIEKRLRWQWRRPQSTSWRVDETYVKVRANGHICTGLSTSSAMLDVYRFLSVADAQCQSSQEISGQALNSLKDWEKPIVINTDKAPTYGIAISDEDGRQMPKRACAPAGQISEQRRRGRSWQAQTVDQAGERFKTLRTAYATIKGFKIMQALRKGQAAIFNLTDDIRSEVRIVERAFVVGTSTLTEVATLLVQNAEGKTA